MIFLLIIILTLPLILSANSDNDFTKYRYDNNNTGMIQGKGPVQLPKLMWVKRFSGNIIASPIVYKNIIYFGDLKNYFYAMDLESGKLIWSKRLKKRGIMPLGIHSSPAIYKNRVIITNADGYLYAFHRKTGRLLWGPKNLQQEVYSSPVISNKYVYIATAGQGILWIFKAYSGERLMKEKIELKSSVYTTPILRKVQTVIDIHSKSKENPTYEIYITVPSKVIIIRITPRQKKYYRLDDITIEGSITSSPIYNKRNIYFVTRQYLYCVDTFSRQILWIKKIEPMFNFKIKKSYPSPTLNNNTLYIGNRGYSIANGDPNWFFWSIGNITADSLGAPGIIYLGGAYTLYNSTQGFIAGVHSQTEKLLFWYIMTNPLLSSPIIANNSLIFSTTERYLYVIR